MNIRKRAVTSFRPIAALLFVLALAMLLAFGWPTIARLQTVDVDSGPKTEKTVGSKAKKPGFPNINFDDGIDIRSPNKANNGASGTLLASADFDSDGTVDLVVADTSGLLEIYHGDPAAKRSEMLNIQGLETPEPFSASGVSISLGFSPDYLETGDFNADGHKDILAASNGGNSIVLLAGNGRGNFSAPTSISVRGQITAFAVGEIGLADGQADVAIAVTNTKGAQLLVFEHPESAFKYPPETFDLSTPASYIAFGDLNGDHYSDIAVGGGRLLTIVSERGQAYPWDTLKGSGIKRPAAIVERRQMPSNIEGLAIGNFNGERQKSLAILSGTSVVRLKPADVIASNRNPTTALTGKTDAPRFLPVDIDARNVGTVPEPAFDPAAADRSGARSVDSRQSNEEKEKALRDQDMDDARKFAALDPAEKARLASERTALAAKGGEKARQGFLNTISARPSNLAAWHIETLITDAKLATAGSVSAKRMLNARVSSSGSDDLLITGANGLEIFTEPRDENGSLRPEVVSLSTDSAVEAILPVRVNGDAMDDIVMLNAGSNVPTVLQTAPTAIIIVNTADDVNTACDGVGTCSLRTAITQANTQPGSIVAILIPGVGVHTISPLTQLPIIRANGTRLAGATDVNTGAKLVEITGGQAGLADGIKIRASNCSVSDLVINNFQGISDPNTGSTTGSNSITIESSTLSPTSSNNLIASNYLGTDSTGTIAKNGGTGILIFDADSNDILSNVMSGLRTGALSGIGLDITAGNDNFILGNVIGTTSNGDALLRNGTGVFMSGANNRFGGDGAGEGNVVSGNGTDRLPGDQNYPGCDGTGIIVAPLVDLETGLLLTEFNTFKGNRLGTSADGTQSLGNCGQAIRTVPQTSTTIGSITPTGRNIISGNGLDAIWCGIPGSPYNEGGYCAIAGNNIGTDITGTVSIPNTIDNIRSGLNFITGVVTIVNSDTYSYFGSPGGTTPGGACTGFCNLLSGQYTETHNVEGNSFLRVGWGTVGAFGNFVGTDQSGTQALPNLIGIGMGGATYDPTTSYIGGYGTDANGNDVLMGNLLSGNNGSGANCGAYAYGVANCNVYNNLVGTDTTGTNIVANGEFAEAAFIVTNGFGSTAIGGPDPLARNVIAGNHNSGIGLRNYGGDILVSNNYIGVNKLGASLGNEANGIFAYFGSATIGGSPADANTIADNGGAGVLIPNPYSVIGFVASGVNISQNHVRDNSGLGIDLSPTALADGVTANDCVDHDEGPNELQNFPVMIAPVFNGDGTVTISGSLSSEVAKPYRLDFYSSQTADPSNYGEGDSYIGSINVTTNGNGFVTFATTSPGTVPAGSFITATATNPNGSTSEFSCAAGLCTPNGATVEDLASPSLTCAQPIIVNVTTDEPDADPADGECDIDTNLPGLQCSLRAAIQEANSRYALGQGKQDIVFDISSPFIVPTISLLSPLPVITSNLEINGMSQRSSARTPQVEIDGTNAGAAATGLKVTGNAHVYITGLVINRFNGGTGIWLEGAGSSTVDQCFIGTNVDGTVQLGTMQNGIVINDSPNNLVGPSPSSTTNSVRNLLAGSVNNINIQGPGSQNNKVAGNYFDLDVTGTIGLPNGNGTGVLIQQGANHNTVGNVGNPVESQVNFIGNEIIGIEIADGANANSVAGNIISNSLVGIAILRASNNTIGFEFNRSRNVIGDCHIGVYIGDVGRTTRPQTAAFPGDANGRFSSFAEARRSLDETVSRVLMPRVSARHPASPQSNTTGNIVQGNTIGIGIHTGNLSTDYGVVLGQSSGNLIGGNTRTQKNLISYNKKYGVILDEGSDDNTLQNNFIGLDATGNAEAPNLNGVGIAGTNNKLIRNVISGNTEDGVQITTSSPGAPEPTGNVLRGMNLIGTNSDGTSAIPNRQHGVNINFGTDNKIGLAGDGNVISGNRRNGGIQTGVGVVIEDPVIGNSIAGNKIGTDISGTYAIGNEGAGILLMGSQTYVGGNTISGNEKTGILIRNFPGNSSAPSGNIVQSNRIGTNLSGTAAIPNKIAGVLIENGANLNIIGGLVDNFGDPATISNGINRLGNLISGNEIGIALQTGDLAGATPSFQNRVQGNLIGTNASGTAAIPNGRADGTGHGIYITKSPQNLIGGFGADIPLARNVISGNNKLGIEINGNISSENRVSGNFIGTQIDGVSFMGNGLGGIAIRLGAHHNIIGGTEPNAGNIIEFNAKAGVYVYADAGCCNLVDPNQIFNNGSKGIDLGCADITPPDQEISDVSNCSILPLPNDPDDADTGGNNLQNYPEISNFGIDANGDLIVSYLVDSLPGNSNYGASGLPGLRVELFKADAQGQGQVFLGADQYTAADYNSLTGQPNGKGRPTTAAAAGVKTINLGNAAALGFGPGDRVTATATDADGNTSEFFPSFAPSAAGVSISGRVTYSDGRPLDKVLLTIVNARGETMIALTNPFGYYLFEDVEAGESYVLAVSSKRVRFANPTRFLTITDAIENVDFIAQEPQ